MATATVEKVVRKTALATIKEAAEYLHIGRTTVYQMMEGGELPFVRLRGCRRVRWTDLDKLASGEPVGA